MGAHAKYRTLINEINAAGIDCALIRDGTKSYKVTAGNHHRSYRNRNSANKFIVRIHTKEVKNSILIKNKILKHT